MIETSSLLFLAALAAVAPPEGSPPASTDPAAQPAPTEPAAQPAPADPAAQPAPTAAPDPAASRRGPEKDPFAAPVGSPAAEPVALEPAVRPSAESGPPADSEETSATGSASPNLKTPFPVETAAPPPPPPPKRTYPDIPIRWRVEIALGGGTDAFFDPNFRGVSERRNWGRVDLAARADARLGESPFFLGGVAGIRGFRNSPGSIYGVAEPDIDLFEPYFAARFSWMAIEGVDVYLEAGGGPSLIDYRVFSDGTHDDQTVSGYALGQAGAMLYLPKRWLGRKGSSRVTVGLDLGLGGVYRPDLDIRPPRDTPEDPIDTGRLDLGSVGMSGLTWRAGLFVRFM